MTAQAATVGFPPSVLIQPYNPERKKYQKAWSELPEYRMCSPGERLATVFLSQVKPPRGSEVIDFGCGTGRGGMRLAMLGDLKVTMLDFADNSLDDEVRECIEARPDRLKFIEWDLTRVLPVAAAYGFCCDVMEHIPEKDVLPVLANILSSANKCFFSIGTEEDNLGAEIGENLHVTVKPASWWAEKLKEAGAEINWQEKRSDGVSFYCSAWKNTRDLIVEGEINVPLDQLESQTAQNIRGAYRQAIPHMQQEREVILLCGGPSMNDSLDTIKHLRENGAALVTVNGAYRWAIDRGLEPSAQIILDARQFNARFVDPVQPQTKYLIASQAHPDVYAALPHDQIYQWHGGISDENEALCKELHGGFWPIFGGSTVVLRSLLLLRMLGFYKLHLFGFDSCVRPDAHHAYAQPENDDERTLPVVCDGKTFICTPWMTMQAMEFIDMVKMMDDELELAVYGDGLIAAMLRAGAEKFSLMEE